MISEVIVKRAGTILAAVLAISAMSMSAGADLTARITAALNGKNGKQAGRLGVCVTLMPSGKVLFAQRADELFTPASNEKIITTASALRTLGEGFQFQTLFWADGPVEGCVLKGNLIVQGDGDPSISGRFHNGDVSFLLRTWAEILVKRGIRSITGDLILDDTLFDRRFTHMNWPAEQLGRWYEAPVGALGFNDSCQNVVVSSAGGVSVRFEPDAHYYTLVNRVSCASSRSAASARPLVITHKPGAPDVVVSGSWLAGRAEETFFIPVDDPTAFFGAALAEEMKRAGIAINGSVRPARNAPPRVTPDDKRVHIIHSSKIIDAVSVCNKNSQNFYAEMLFKRTGAKAFGTGTFETGAKAASLFLADVGIKPGTYAVSDGSGLSRENRFSPRQFATVLGWAFNSDFADDFVDSLGVSGVDRTMRKRLNNPAYRGKVLAKTGTLDGVAALSGYAFNRGGQVLVFSILANDTHGNWAARAVMDDICKALVDEPMD